MTSQFVPTLTNMVNNVRSIIDSYGMGSMRALAQEPVQNSKDAALGDAHVEYRLHQRRSGDGGDSYLLTVTDHNTTGLRGPVLSFEDVQARDNILRVDENWAAFEGMGYSKEDDSALGSRGQGKAAFLYHSRLPRLAPLGQDRMMILYDTLLPDGEYRLGVRYASPFDTVQAPPFDGDDARRIVSSRYTSNDGTEIELGLDPLTSVGARVIVPYLSPEAVDAIHSGELYQWLQCCWWRAVQTGLTINLIDEHGVIQSVAVPSWWQTEPWRKQTNGVKVYDNVEVDDNLKIKRMVFLYDESLDKPDIEGATPQFCGVQLLRGQQWIETLEPELRDYIPRDKRSGFRGFVEFDRGTERELRRAENSQHERFDRRVSGVKALITAVESEVRIFAEEQGWMAQGVTRPAPGRERDAALEFLRFFAPRARTMDGNGIRTAGPSQLRMDLTERWECDLHLDFPDTRSTRVNWGQYISNVDIRVRLQPAPISKHATVSLELAHIDDSSSRTTVAKRRIELRNGEEITRFGDFQIITGAPGPGKMQCAQSGKWRLTAWVESGGVRVARSVSRSIFVNADPPAPGSKPYALSISVQNHTTQQRRINSGDTIGVLISVTNRTVDDQSLALTASVGNLLLADMKQVDVQGTPAGAAPSRTPGVQTTITVNPPTPVTALRQSVSLTAGRHALRADLYLDGEFVAHANRTLDIEVDPLQAQDWPPFRIEQISGDSPHPRWQFDKKSPDDWVLQYPPAYPLYRALNASTNHGGPHLSGVSAFVVDVCAEGVIEWAMEPLDNGDSSRLEELLDGAPVGADPDRYEEYCDKMRALADLRRDPEQIGEYGRLVRDCAARSLSLFEERE